MTMTYIRPASVRNAHRRKHLKGAPPAAKSYWEVRPKSTILFLPAMTLGFSSLLEPDTYEGKTQFKLNLHATVAQAEALADKVQAEVIDAHFKALKAMVEKDKPDVATKLQAKSASDWLEEKLKEPKEKSRIQLPHFTVACTADLKDRQTQQMIRQRVKAWDAKGAPLDLPSLHLGMGSIVSVGVSAALWHGTLAVDKDNKKKPIAWWALPSFRLIGVRVLKLEQFGGAGNSQVGEVSEEDLVGVEEGFEAEDLAQFAQSADKPTPSAPAQFSREDMDDEIPF